MKLTIGHKVLIGAGIIALCVWGGCELGMRRVLKEVGVKTTTKTDTFRIAYPVPVEIQKKQLVYKIRTLHDTLESDGDTIYLPSENPGWVADDLNDYNLLRIYDTTVGKNGDSAKVRTEVWKNQIARQDIDLTTTDSTKTIVLRPPRNIVGYFTLAGAANINAQSSAAIGFALKLPNDRAYQVEYQKIFGIKDGFVKATLFIPIRLTPQKK